MLFPHYILCLLLIWRIPCRLRSLIFIIKFGTSRRKSLIFVLFSQLSYTNRNSFLWYRSCERGLNRYLLMLFLLLKNCITKDRYTSWNITVFNIYRNSPYSCTQLFRWINTWVQYLNNFYSIISLAIFTSFPTLQYIKVPLFHIVYKSKLTFTSVWIKVR